MGRFGSSPSASPGALRGAQRNLSSEDLAIRFVNTAAWRLRSEVEERLASPATLLEWFEANSLLSRGQKTKLQRDWNVDVAAARSVYERAIALRELIYKLLVARLVGRSPRPQDLEAFNTFMPANGASAAIAWQAGEYRWQGQGSTTGAASLLMPITMSAVELLTGARSAKVRQCQDDRGCGWLFVDESRAQNRRWCSMGDCGNRAKAHRHYERGKSNS